MVNLIFLKNIIINNIIGIIGLINVDGDILELKVFLNTKLSISSIGHIITNKHNISSIFNFF